MKGQERSGRLLALSLLAITNSCCSFLLLVMSEKEKGRECLGKGGKNGVGIMCREIESRLQKGWAAFDSKSSTQEMLGN